MNTRNLYSIAELQQSLQVAQDAFVAAGHDKNQVTLRDVLHTHLDSLDEEAMNIPVTKILDLCVEVERAMGTTDQQIRAQLQVFLDKCNKHK